MDQFPAILVIILDTRPGFSCWLHYRGIARIDSSAADERYVAVEVRESRLPRSPLKNFFKV